MNKKNVALIALLLATNVHSANIIFDLGDVLIQTDYLKAWHILGVTNLAQYLAAFHNPKKLRSRLFAFLNLAKQRNEHEAKTCDHSGTLLPQIMCDWMKEKKTPQELLNCVAKTITTNRIFFGSDEECKLLYKAAEMVFLPEYHAKTKCLVPDGVRFVKECKNAGHQVYILSNWDAASFEKIKEQYPEFITLFDGIVISAEVGALKPDPQIYYHLLTAYHLNASDCIFIDDRIENIETAHDLGMHTILCTDKRGFFGKKPDFDHIRAEYKKIQSPQRVVIQ